MDGKNGIVLPTIMGMNRYPLEYLGVPESWGYPQSSSISWHGTFPYGEPVDRGIRRVQRAQGHSELELEIGNAPTIKGPDKVGSILHQWILEVYSYSISFTSIWNCSSKFTNRFTHYVLTSDSPISTGWHPTSIIFRPDGGAHEAWYRCHVRKRAARVRPGKVVPEVPQKWFQIFCWIWATTWDVNQG